MYFSIGVTCHTHISQKYLTFNAFLQRQSKNIYAYMLQYGGPTCHMYMFNPQHVGL